jgi:hypothetical protein
LTADVNVDVWVVGFPAAGLAEARRTTEAGRGGRAAAALADVVAAEVIEGRVVPDPLAPVDAPKLGPVDPVLE